MLCKYYGCRAACVSNSNARRAYPSGMEPDRPSERADTGASPRWTRIVDWLGAQGPVNLAIYSCLVTAAVGTCLLLLPR